MRLLLDQIDVASFYGDLIKQVKRNKVPIRPGRYFPRKRRHKSKYSINKKRAL